MQSIAAFCQFTPAQTSTQSAKLYTKAAATCVPPEVSGDWVSQSIVKVSPETGACESEEAYEEVYVVLSMEEGQPVRGV